MKRALMKAGVLGASGFAGAELLRLAAAHPYVDVVFASGDTQIGSHIGAVHAGLGAAYPDFRFEAWTDIPEGLDVVFLSLPHGVSQQIVPKLDADMIVDLGADFRFKDHTVYESWYGEKHAAPDLTNDFTYGLVELFREEIAGSSAIAVPGCYVTTSVLTMAPLIATGLAEPNGIVVHAASGVSGAGMGLKPSTSFSTVNESMTAYGLLSHRHTPEIETALSAEAGGPVQLLFTPHLAPMNRGILATCYLRPTGNDSTEQLLDQMSSFYAADQFVMVSEQVPATKATLGSNSIHLTVRRDDRTGWIVAIGAIDNLVKGAAGQAIQCLNVAAGFAEDTGLAKAGLFP